MVDNTTLNTGTGGDVIASDDIGGVKYQRIKLGYGDDGVYTGDVSLANPLPVVVRDASVSFKGRAQTFRTPGRAGTAGQKIFALHNATGSAKFVTINQLTVDLTATVVVDCGWAFRVSGKVHRLDLGGH